MRDTFSMTAWSNEIEGNDGWHARSLGSRAMSRTAARFTGPNGHVIVWFRSYCSLNGVARDAKLRDRRGGDYYSSMRGNLGTW